MHPASLVPRSGKDLVERLPEAECTVTNGDFRSDLQSPSFHIDEKFAPALRAFPNANLEADEFLLALRRSPNQHQHAFAVVFHPSLQEYTVGPHIQVSSRRQIPLLPMPVLALPLCRQTGNHRRRQVRCVLAQQRGQCLLEVPGRDATQQRIQALRAPCPQRQNRRGEPDPLAVAGSPAIPNLHPGNLDSTDPRLDRAFGTMTVPDNTVSSISKTETLHLGKKCLGFQLDSLRQQLSRTRSQDIGQGIIDLVGVTKTNNIAILIHGVSLSLRGSGRLDPRLDTPPISLRHHPGSSLAHGGWLAATLGPSRLITFRRFFSTSTTVGDGGADAYDCSGDGSLIAGATSVGGGTMVDWLVSMTTRSGGC